MSDATATITDYRCPKHPAERLSNVLCGGAGFCRRCNLFVQAAGIAAPQLDEWVLAKRAASKPAKKKRTVKKATGKAARPSPRPARSPRRSKLAEAGEASGAAASSVAAMTDPKMPAAPATRTAALEHRQP